MQINKLSNAYNAANYSKTNNVMKQNNAVSFQKAPATLKKGFVGAAIALASLGVAANANAQTEPNDSVNTEVRVASAPKKIYINDIEEVQKAIDRYNKKSASYRQPIVNDTKAKMETRLNNLDLTIKTEYDEMADMLNCMPVKAIMLPYGGTYSMSELWQEALEYTTNALSEKYNDVQINVGHALDMYIPGNDVYRGRGLMTGAEDVVLNNMGYEDLKSFCDKLATLPIYSEEQNQLVDTFGEGLRELYTDVMSENRPKDEAAAAAYRSGYEAAKPNLEATVQEGITEDNSPWSVDYSTGRIFENNLIAAYKKDKATIIENYKIGNKSDKEVLEKNTKINIKGKIFDVGKLYKESDSNSGTNFVVYDRNGKKHAVSGLRR